MDNSLDLKDLLLLPDLDQAEVAEFITIGTERTKAFCMKCNINWASLHSQEDNDRDETYEYCPVCKNDMYLTDPVDGPAYIKNPVGPEIIDAETKEPLIRIVFNPNYLPLQPPTQFDREAYIKKMEESQAFIDKAIEIYQQVFISRGKEAAEKAYFEALNSSTT